METKTRKLIILICIFFIFNFSCIISFILYDNIFYPAYLSVEHGCNVITDDELNNLGYFVGGYVIDGNIIYVKNNQIVNENEVDKSTILHERCHQFFYIHNLSHSCSYPKFRYIEEMICYSYGYFFG